MVVAARVMEQVGVSGYLGTGYLIQDPLVLNTVASILTTQSRHNTMMNMFQKAMAIPTAFGLPLTAPEVISIGTRFVTGCDLGVKANPPLSINDNDISLTSGTPLTFNSSVTPALNGNTAGLNCQILASGQANATVFPLNECVVPNVEGAIAVWITNHDTPLSGDVIKRQNQSIVAGPMIRFSDNTNDETSDLIRLNATAT